MYMRTSDARPIRAWLRIIAGSIAAGARRLPDRMGKVLRCLPDFFPRRCMLCRAAFDTGREALCPDCFRRLREQLITERIVCPSCLQRRTLFADGICSHCRGKDNEKLAAHSLAHYEEPLMQLIHALKYGGVPLLAADLGELLALGSADLEGEYLVTWVPLSFRRWLQRGYNQAELLARAFARYTGRQPIALLCKTRHNRRQARLHSRERRENARGVYGLLSAEAARGKRILLVDDVLTTGATSLACAEVLLAGEAAEVRILTLCCG
jgi:ComF family protein